MQSILNFILHILKIEIFILKFIYNFFIFKIMFLQAQ